MTSEEITKRARNPFVAKEKTMANAPPVVTPGSTTSEYKLTLGVLLSALAIVITYLGLMFTDLYARFPQAGWMSTAITAIAMVAALLKALGYDNGRTELKKAAMLTAMPEISNPR